MTAKRTINVGVIGTGVGRMHAWWFSVAPDSRVLALCDVNEPELSVIGDKYDVPLRFTDYRKLLEVEELDAVVVASPNDLHAEMTLAALDRGLHVFCEKPMAPTLVDAERMVAAATRANRRLMLNMAMRYRSDIAPLKELVDQGRLGEAYCGHITFYNPRGLLGTPYGGNEAMGRGHWFVDKAHGGGCLMDVGVHFIDLAWWFMGMPKPLTVLASQFDHVAPPLYRKMGLNFTVDEMISVQVACEGGRAIHLAGCWAANTTRSRSIRIFGTEGGISCPPPLYHRPEGVDTIVNELVTPIPLGTKKRRPQPHFIECVRNPEMKMSASGEECLTVARILDAVERSAKSGRGEPVGDGR